MVKNIKSKKGRKYTFPSKYYLGLSKKDKKKQITELKKSQELYKKGIYVAEAIKTHLNQKNLPI